MTLLRCSSPSWDAAPWATCCIPQVPDRATVGDVVLADACLFLDRLRTREQNVFDWGLWGGGCIPSAKMKADLGLKGGVLTSQIGYAISKLQTEIIDKAS